MATSWTTPTTVIQYADPQAEQIHVSWDESDNFSGISRKNQFYTKTVNPLVHIARSPKPDITNKTYYLQLTGYNFVDVPEVITGIELQLICDRGGRITDDTVQLVLNGAAIGENVADRNLDQIKIYGGELPVWSTQPLTASDVQNGTFGVLLRFKSHPQWPHKTTAKIDSAELRIY
jgi:hypothetical protein